MAFKFNPLIFSGLDLTGSSSGGMSIGGPVAGSTPYSILSIDGASNLDELGPLTNGQLLIGVTGGAAVPATLTGTASQVIITNGAGSITLSLPQNIATSSNPSFNTLSLTAASNQLSLSTAANGLVINSGTSAAARTYTVPDVGTTGTFMMLEGAQTVTGIKSFSSVILANGNIDVTATGGTDSLNIGIANADVVNIGRSGATINIQGTTFYQNVTNLLVSDKLFTVNVGGSAGSGSDSGFEIEENALITGYVKTSPDRNSFLLKAPNTAGDVTLTPGASGITINQSSHDPVTIGTANGLSLVGQVLSLALSSTSTTGALSSTDWNTFNNKQAAGNYITALTGDVTATGPGSVAATIANLAVTNAKIANATIDLTTKVTGILPIANGGTNNSSYTAGSIIFSDGTKLAENNALFFWDDATTRLFIGANTSLGGSNAGIQYSNAAVANRGQIKLHSYFAGSSVAGVSTLTSQSGTVGVNNAVTAGNDYSKWTAQAGAATVGSAPISGTFAFKANTVNSLTVTSDFHIALTNLAGTLGDRLYLGSEGALRLPNYTTGIAHFDGSGNITSSAVSLTTDVSGILPIANGGTNSSAALTNGKIMSSVAGAIVESAINTSDVAALVAEGSFSAANNQVAAADITGLAFANASIRSFQTIISIAISATSSLFAQYQLNGIQKGSSWEMTQEFVGDDTGVVFSITAAGQVQYTSSNLAGFVSDTMKYKSLTTSV